MEYKQNIELGDSRIESSRDFYRKSEVAILGLCLYYKVEGITQKINISFISENLSHDSFFTKQAIRKLLNTEAFDYVNKLFFWSDCGNHFKSKEMVHFLMKQLPQGSFFSSIQLNLFAEYHGKSEIDGHFGVLSRCFKEEKIAKEIKNIDDLIAFYREKS